ncbi:hypothetical protein ACYZTR_09225 [Pseudomonas sp. Hz4]
MKPMENFVAVDWRSDRDKCYFFFKDTKKYSRFDNSYNEVDYGYPKYYTRENWGVLHQHLSKLRFGFHTSNIITENKIELDADILWLFYYDGETPMFCEYDQDADSNRGMRTIKGSQWAPLLPYFNRIVAGTWWEGTGLFKKNKTMFRFILDNGEGLDFDWKTQQIATHPIDETSWPGLTPYTDRIITAVKIHATFGDSYYYIFLTNNEYLKYNIQQNHLTSAPFKVNNETWPNLQKP